MDVSRCSVGGANRPNPCQDSGTNQDNAIVAANTGQLVSRGAAQTEWQEGLHTAAIMLVIGIEMGEIRFAPSGDRSMIAMTS